MKKRQKGLKTAIPEWNKKHAELKKQEDKLFEIYNGTKWYDVERNIRKYHQHTEVRMQGIADIIKNGRITPENIFANTWLLEAACKN